MKKVRIYKITFPNGKAYVGATKLSIKARMQRHETDSDRRSTSVGKAIREFGRKNYETELLQITTESKRYACEMAQIKKHNTLVPNGYNMAKGGPGANGVVRSKEFKSKCSAAAKNRSASHRERLSEANRKRIISEETKKRMSESAKKRANSKEGRLHMLNMNKRKSNVKTKN